MKTKIISVLTVVLILFSISCSKYEDGPILSFRSKKTRIDGSWKYESIIYTDQNLAVTENLPDTVLTFTSDGNYSDNKGYMGTWKFSGSVDISITKSKGAIQQEVKWEIIRLSKKQLWFRRDNEEHHFKAL